jgi:hypothetical protein
MNTLVTLAIARSAGNSPRPPAGGQTRSSNPQIPTHPRIMSLTVRADALAAQAKALERYLDERDD